VFIELLGELRIQRRNPLPRLSVLAEGMHGTEELRTCRITAQICCFAIALREFWLVVKQVHMRRPAAHREKNHTLRPCGKMRRF
jgi:hypothetical protein